MQISFQLSNQSNNFITIRLEGISHLMNKFLLEINLFLYIKYQITDKYRKMNDERDRLIIQLRRELEQYQQNERDYADLNFLLTNLEHRYNLLNDEKKRLEQDFAVRNETNLQTIAMHRADIDQLREDLSYSQNTVFKLREQIAQKEIEIQQLYVSFQNIQPNTEDLYSQRSQLLAENKQYQQRIENLQFQLQQQQNTLKKQEDELLRLLEEKGNIQILNEKLKLEINELKSVKEQMQIDKKSVQKQLEKVEAQLKRTHEQLQTNTETLLQLEQIKVSLEKQITLTNKLEDEVHNQKLINTQLHQNNEHFQLTVEKLMNQNDKLQKELLQKEVLQLAPKPIIVEQKDSKEIISLRKIINEQEGLIFDLTNDKKSLQSKIELVQQVLDQTKQQYNFLKEEIANKKNEQTERKISINLPKNDSEISDLKNQIIHLEQQLQIKDRWIECYKMGQQKNVNEEYTKLRTHYESLEREYQVAIQIYQAENDRVRSLTLELEMKEKQLEQAKQLIKDMQNQERKKISQRIHELEIENMKLRQENESYSTELLKAEKKIKQLKTKQKTPNTQQQSPQRLVQKRTESKTKKQR